MAENRPVYMWKSLKFLKSSPVLPFEHPLRVAVDKILDNDDIVSWAANPPEFVVKKQSAFCEEVRRRSQIVLNNQQILEQLFSCSITWGGFRLVDAVSRRTGVLLRSLFCSKDLQSEATRLILDRQGRIREVPNDASYIKIKNMIECVANHSCKITKFTNSTLLASGIDIKTVEVRNLLDAVEHDLTLIGNLSDEQQQEVTDFDHEFEKVNNDFENLRAQIALLPCPIENENLQKPEIVNGPVDEIEHHFRGHDTVFENARRAMITVNDRDSVVNFERLLASRVKNLSDDFETRIKARQDEVHKTYKLKEADVRAQYDEAVTRFQNLQTAILAVPLHFNLIRDGYIDESNRLNPQIYRLHGLIDEIQKKRLAQSESLSNLHHQLQHLLQKYEKLMKIPYKLSTDTEMLKKILHKKLDLVRNQMAAANSLVDGVTNRETVKFVKESETLYQNVQQLLHKVCFDRTDKTLLREAAEFETALRNCFDQGVNLQRTRNKSDPDLDSVVFRISQISGEIENLRIELDAEEALRVDKENMAAREQVQRDADLRRMRVDFIEKANVITSTQNIDEQDKEIESKKREDGGEFVNDSSDMGDWRNGEDGELADSKRKRRTTDGGSASEGEYSALKKKRKTKKAIVVEEEPQKNKGEVKSRASLSSSSSNDSDNARGTGLNGTDQDLLPNALFSDSDDSDTGAANNTANTQKATSGSDANFDSDESATPKGPAPKRARIVDSDEDEASPEGPASPDAPASPDPKPAGSKNRNFNSYKELDGKPSADILEKSMSIITTTENIDEQDEERKDKKRGGGRRKKQREEGDEFVNDSSDMGDWRNGEGGEPADGGKRKRKNKDKKKRKRRTTEGGSASEGENSAPKKKRKAKKAVVVEEEPQKNKGKVKSRAYLSSSSSDDSDNARGTGLVGADQDLFPNALSSNSDDSDTGAANKTANTQKATSASGSDANFDSDESATPKGPAPKRARIVDSDEDEASPEGPASPEGLARPKPQPAGSKNRNFNSYKELDGKPSADILEKSMSIITTTENIDEQDKERKDKKRGGGRRKKQREEGDEFVNDSSDMGDWRNGEGGEPADGGKRKRKNKDKKKRKCRTTDGGSVSEGENSAPKKKRKAKKAVVVEEEPQKNKGKVKSRAYLSSSSSDNVKNAMI